MGSRPWKAYFDSWMDKHWDRDVPLTVKRGKRKVTGKFRYCWQRGYSTWGMTITTPDGENHEFLLDRDLLINGEPVVAWYDKQAHPHMRKPGAMH